MVHELLLQLCLENSLASLAYLASLVSLTCGFFAYIQLLAVFAWLPLLLSGEALYVASLTYQSPEERFVKGQTLYVAWTN